MPTGAGFVYVAFVIDAFARRIVGWKVSAQATSGFVLDALEQAIHAPRPGPKDGLIHHSDRGVRGRHMAPWICPDVFHNVLEHMVFTGCTFQCFSLCSATSMPYRCRMESHMWLPRNSGYPMHTSLSVLNWRRRADSLTADLLGRFVWASATLK